MTCTSCTAPTVVRPVVRIDSPELSLMEYFGPKACGKEGTLLCVGKVKDTKAKLQKPQEVQEHVMCIDGTIDFTGPKTEFHIKAGQNVVLPKGLELEYSFPSSAAFVVVTLDEDTAVHEKEPRVVEKVDVVDAPGITITEHFGWVASKDGAFSLASARVREASEEAYQAPLFDEFVICNEGSIEFLHGEERLRLQEGEAVFLPKSLRVKWIWPQATRYTVLCLPAFSPELSGREAEEGATVAKDSKSMERLEALHAKVEGA